MMQFPQGDAIAFPQETGLLPQRLTTRPLTSDEGVRQIGIKIRPVFIEGKRFPTPRASMAIWWKRFPPPCGNDSRRRHFKVSGSGSRQLIQHHWFHPGAVCNWRRGLASPPPVHVQAWRTSRDEFELFRQ
jgi:hypothetical protein